MRDKTLLVIGLLLGFGCGGGGNAPDAMTGGGVDAGIPDAFGCDLTLLPGWNTLAPLPGGARQETAVVAVGGKIYVMGGFQGFSDTALVEVYDPCLNTWDTAAPLPQVMHHINAAAVNGKIYIVGAMTGLTFTPLANVWEYDPLTDRWTPKSSMNNPQVDARGSSAVGAIGEKIYVVGGSDSAEGSSTLASTYHTVDDRWDALPPLPEARNHLMGAAAAGAMYAIGGRNGGIEGVKDRVDKFDPATNTWSIVMIMPTARGGAAVGVVEDKIYVFGGEGNVNAPPDQVFPQSEVYDPANNQWVGLTPMLTPRHGTGAVGFGGVLWVPGGADVQGFGAVDTFEAFVP